MVSRQKTVEFHFAPDWHALGDKNGVMPKLPDQMDNIEAAVPDAPFRLVTAPARSFLNSTFTEMASGKRREGRPTVLMHPDDAKRLGVADGSKGTPRECAGRGRPACAHFRWPAAGDTGFREYLAERMFRGRDRDQRADE